MRILLYANGQLLNVTYIVYDKVQGLLCSINFVVSLCTFSVFLINQTNKLINKKVAWNVSLLYFEYFLKNHILLLYNFNATLVLAFFYFQLFILSFFELRRRAILKIGPYNFTNIIWSKRYKTVTAQYEKKRFSEVHFTHLLLILVE